MNKTIKYALLAGLCAPLLTGCVTPGEDDPNAMTKQGAAGGALLGLTLGALTGEPELAVKGAIAGGVTGGVAGAQADVQDNREGMRANSRDDAIASIGNHANQPNTQQSWQELNHFVGNWNVSIQNHDNSLNDLDPIDASGTLASTTQANIAVSNRQGIDLTAAFSFTPESGYQLNVTNNATQVEVRFAGEFQPNTNRYVFYPTNVSDVIYQGINTADIHVELGFAGQNVWSLSSFAFMDNKQNQLQTFRFTKAS
ncbi:hypothetical protein VISI1226_10907 [Vibrio sinaloensis DSM 21326]|uniref:Glycine zipper domain-containing protein n=1 Tax=Vibrio sinaloensis DSM 21326 TaxID=945550 RepID=E8MB03_PHOS4|nr:hypothetical protein [Vibrio sinaloensis]EGA68833.1 hypothetical protein VISI1226_10907 [Vibrio sinaloensis DSM 21326]